MSNRFTLFLAAAAVAVATAVMPVAANAQNICQADLAPVTQLTIPRLNDYSNETASAVLFDDTCTRLYAVVAREAGRVYPLLLASNTWESPIEAGTGPGAADISPDGKHLYLANGDNTVSIVDLAARRETGRIQLPETPRNLKVAANGFILVTTENAVLKIDPASRSVTHLLSRESGFLGFTMGRSGDRSLIVLTSTNRSYRYWADSDILAPITGSAYTVMNRDGSVAIKETSLVNMRSGSGTSLGYIPAAERGVGAQILSPDGRYAYDVTVDGGGHTPFSYVEMVDLVERRRKRFLSPGFTVLNGLAISPDGRQLAAFNAGAIYLMRTDPDAKVWNRVSTFTPRFNSLYSLLRFHNTGTQTGTAKVTLRDFDTGEVVVSWESPPIAPGAAPQFYVKDIPDHWTISTRPFKYVASFETNFPGTAAHVVWYPGGPITNASTCDMHVGASPRVVANVHSSRIGDDYPSEITVLNNGAEAQAVFGLYDARDGRKLGSYAPGVIGQGQARAFSATELERAAGITPDEGMTHYVIKLEGTMNGTLQHLIFHRPSQVLADMTTTCALSTP